MMKKITALLLSVALAFCLVGCGSTKEEQTSITIQFVPTNNDGIDATTESFEAYLEDILGIDVEVTVATNYTTIVEAMESGQVDIGIMPPAAYVQARGLGAGEAILSSTLIDYDQKTELPIEGSTAGTFKAEVLVKTDSDIDSYEDLVGKKVAYLGVSSAQFDDGNRGFSDRYDAKLDMRMNKDTQLTAEIVVNTYSLQNLAKILKEYGEEPFAYSIAKEIVKQRQIKPISTTFELVEVIKKALPSKVLNKKGHPAKLTFQAIRIEVNNELGVLKKGLKDACNLLKPNGRVAVITFHSLEDRIVKNIFKELTDVGEGSRYLPVESKEPLYRLVNRKPIIPTIEEIDNNNRSHSAKLRIIERR